MNAPAYASSDATAPVLSLRQQARLEGVSASTIHRHRQRAAKAQPTATVDLAAAVQALTTAQAQQSALLTRLLGGDTEIRLPKTAKEPKAEKEEKPVAGGTLADPEEAERRVHGRRYILTSAQNNSHVHAGLLASLLTMAKHTGAELLVSAFTYNKNAWNNGSNVTAESADVYYAEELAPYLQPKQAVRLADDLVFCAQLDRLPTSADPLAKLDSYTRSSSGIVGHPRVAAKSMPVMKGEAERTLFSTGCITQRNYVDRLAGQVAAFHHTFAALYVEVDADGTWFARQLVAEESGHFQDLTTVYTPVGTRQARPAGIVWGDIHRKWMEDEIVQACWGQGGILETLRPLTQVKHDVLHFQGRSHHALKDPFLMAEFKRNGDDSVEAEIAGDARFLAETEGPDDCETIIPEANHHTHLRRWLSEADFRSDPVNARFGHYLAYRTHEAIEEGRGAAFNVYEFAVREKAADLQRTRFLGVDESCEVAGIEVGIHGDLGPNGSRGSPKAFRALGKRAVTGHTHTAGIVDGIYTVGVTAALDQGYNKGASSWSHTHCIIYESGKRSLLTMRGARWRGEPLPAAKPRVRVQAGRSAA